MSIYEELIKEKYSKELSNESKEPLTEIPHIEVNDTIFDLELEKLHNINDIIVFFKKLFSGRKVEDKHGNTISLKTREEKLEFLLDLANSFVFKRLLSKIKEDTDFHFFGFFKNYIKKEQYNENFRNNVFEVIEEAYYLNDIFFNNAINLDDIEFSLSNKGNTLYECKKLILNENIVPTKQSITINVNQFKSYEEFRKSLLESLMNIYLNINNKLYLENTNKKKDFLYRNMKKNINNYGEEIYNNWIEI